MNSLKPTGEWLRRYIVAAAMLGVLILPALSLPDIVAAQETVTVQLEAIGDSGVAGTATLTAEGEGTKVTLGVNGLAPGVTAASAMHAGTCEMPSASSAALPDLEADAAGAATGSGWVLFRGTEAVALETMADGEHIIAVQAERIVACGVIPKLVPAPLQLPVTGRAAPIPPAIGAAVAGLCALLIGAWQVYSPRSDD